CNAFNFSDEVQLVFKNSSDVVSESIVYQVHNHFETKSQYEIEIDALKAQVENLKLSIDTINNDREFLLKSIETIMGSLSWKITMPFRKIKSIIFNKR
ncbi:SAM-dependent methyltransferase, partial [Vibrio cholerae]|nr:SAM-dependent methyltransferase [Vibrio cholerae]